MNKIAENIGKGIRKTILYLILSIFLVIFAYPFYTVFVLGTHSIGTIYTNPPPMLPGDKLQENWVNLFKTIPFHLNIMNSILVAVLQTGTVIFFCTMAGFALAKYNFKGKNIIYTFILLTLMIPPFLSIIPAFQMMVWFRWINTYFPLFVPGMASAFGIFIMTQFITTSVPSELMDAARIDGLNEFSILLNVGFPLSMPGIAVLGTVTFIGSWNNFLWAMIMLQEKSMHTIPVALSAFQMLQEGTGAFMGSKFLGNAIAIIPLLLIFLIFSKRIISNFLAGSIKG
ncbi:MAG: carbohydrate ABC transporter permease [Spirochaetales bacterium]|nr:carbohydrate ABC transporter permease [Spirochaetales bacterium]